MDAREQRGLEIAARCKVVRRGLGWSVPSQSGSGKYTVTGLPRAMEGGPRCSCPDFELRGQPCKHIFAVRMVIQREFDYGNGTVTETVSVTKTVKRTYRQDWPGLQRGADEREGQIHGPAPRSLRRPARARAEGQA